VPVGILILQDSGRTSVQVNRYGASCSATALRRAARAAARSAAACACSRASASSAPTSTAAGRARARAHGRGFEAQLVRGDGERRDVMIIGDAAARRGGEVRGGIAAIVDISERKNAETRQQVLLTSCSTG
jgi:two-component system CheB/CheR fusion protein